jgi:hypothetical protein
MRLGVGLTSANSLSRGSTCGLTADLLLLELSEFTEEMEVYLVLLEVLRARLVIRDPLVDDRIGDTSGILREASGT